MDTPFKPEDLEALGLSMLITAGFIYLMWQYPVNSQYYLITGNRWHWSEKVIFVVALLFALQLIATILIAFSVMFNIGVI